MKRLIPTVIVIASLLPLSAVADDQGSNTAPSPVVTLPATSSKSTPSTSASKPATTQSTNSAPTLASSLASIRKLIEAKSFTAALAALKDADKSFPNNADINNLLGFASRNLKQYSTSDKYYAKALKLNPNHLGALEYQGELFLKLKKLAAAKANLAKLKKLCGTSCEEYLDLQKAIGSK
jgi:tetratricopeptide (TPR) repeat protein